MKIRITLFIIIGFVVVLSSGCYLGQEDSFSDVQTFTIDAAAQNPLGYAGDGWYMRAKVYTPEDISSMESSGTLYYEDYGVEGGYIQYPSSGLLPPETTTSFFLGQNPPIQGIAVIVALPPRKYRIIVEYIDVAEMGTSIWIRDSYLSPELDVQAGENLNVDFTFWSYTDS